MQYIEGYHAYHRHFSSFTVFEMVLVTNNRSSVEAPSRSYRCHEMSRSYLWPRVSWQTCYNGTSSPHIETTIFKVLLGLYCQRLTSMEKPNTRSRSKSITRAASALGNIQSHVSVTSSQQRLRTHFQTIVSEKCDKGVSTSLDDLENNIGLPETSVSLRTSPIFQLWLLILRAWSKYPWVTFCVLVYCSLSALAFAFTISGYFPPDMNMSKYDPRE